MFRKPLMLLAGAALLTAPAFLPALAHCPSLIPVVRMQTPSDGVAIQEACYADYSFCVQDTFYRDTLRQELVNLYRSSRHAVFAYVDSVRNYETYDTTWYRGEINFIDTFTTERIVIGIHTHLKDTLPERKLTFIDRWIAFTGNPLSTTYTTLRDTPFVAFFNQYDSIRKLGIGPMDGCFFEPTVFHIVDNRIHKKGLVGYRMPGVSLSLEDFLQAIGHEPVPAPPVGLARRKAPPALSFSRKEGPWYDLNGRRSGQRRGRGWAYSRWGVPILAMPESPAAVPDGIGGDQ